jgi:transposase
MSDWIKYHDTRCEVTRLSRTLLIVNNTTGGVRWERKYRRQMLSGRDSATASKSSSPLKLLHAGQKPGTQLALELGIRRNLLYKWAETLAQHGGNTETAFQGSGRNKPGKHHDPLKTENARLKRELARVYVVSTLALQMRRNISQLLKITCIRKLFSTKTSACGACFALRPPHWGLTFVPHVSLYRKKPLHGILSLRTSRSY